MALCLKNGLTIHTLALVGRGIVNNNQLLAPALGVSFAISWFGLPSNAEAVAGWGRKKSFYKAKKKAKKYKKPLITLEDGFLRSLDSGIGSRYGASFVVDDVGIYFDVRYENRLEQLILDCIAHWNDDKQHCANRLIKKITDNKLSKYNASLFAPNLKKITNNDKPNLLIVDQVANDASIVGAGADERDFVRMVEIAKSQFQEHNIIIKTHPAGIGYFNKNFQNNHQDTLFFVSENCNPIALLEQVDVVFSVSSHLGFEGLLLNKQVYAFGVSWYCGFGLTNDEFVPKKLYEQVLTRRQSYYDTNPKMVNVAQLFYAAYIDYSVYADPASAGTNNIACDIGVVIDYLITNRNHALKLNGHVLSWNLSRWKKGFFEQFFSTPFNQLTIHTKSPYLGAMPTVIQTYLKNQKKPYQSKQYQHILAWGTVQQQQLKSTPSNHDHKIWCIEDGFVRSKGLGASLVAPLSLVCDGLGIYYNPKTPSDLEVLLATLTLDDEKMAQAKRLQNVLIHQNISKYNVGNALVGKENFPTDVTIRLVVGQVEDDASILNCLSPITQNGELLKTVRAEFPDDFIIYKPHPDVEAGLRVGKVDEETIKLADFVANEVSIGECLEACDVLHTISSQSGFEALLRGKQVVCYGLPFYAGFGLTMDVENNNPLYLKALERRARQQPLSLYELIYATLIAYPLYRLPNGYGLAQAWQVAEFLTQDMGEDFEKIVQWRTKILGHFYAIRRKKA